MKRLSSSAEIDQIMKKDLNTEDIEKKFALIISSNQSV
jgi:hypothetical protein